MSRVRDKNWSIMLGLVVAVLSGIMLFASTQSAQADQRDRWDQGDRRGGGFREFRDSRYQHERTYPARGQFIRALPRDHRVVVHGSSRYYFHGGIWYRPSGGRFLIVAPPIGLFVPFLPPFYSTIWLGRVPYYYANEVYYANRGDGYIVVAPPAEQISQAPPPVEQMFIYPRQGQSEKQQADDRYACHRWAADQTGFDPTQSPGGNSKSRGIEKRADYQRAMSACLDGRGYTVK